MAVIRQLRKTAEIYPLHSIRVVDGDTLEASILLPFGTQVRRRIRLRGWWADEIGGAFHTQGIQARDRLLAYLQGKAIWLHAPSCRTDRYGRVLGHLMHHERIILAKDVLGDLQLTEAEHKLRKDQKGPTGLSVKPSREQDMVDPPAPPRALLDPLAAQGGPFGHVDYHPDELTDDTQYGPGAL